MSTSSEANGENEFTRREPIDPNLTSEEVARLCELQRAAGATSCKREGNFLVTTWRVQ